MTMTMTTRRRTMRVARSRSGWVDKLTTKSEDREMFKAKFYIFLL